MRSVLVAFVALAFSTPVFAQSLSGNQIRQALVGHTINGVENGQSYSQYLNPNGTITGHSASGDYTGRWRIQENEICFLEEESTKWDCNEVKLRGNQIIWDDGSTATLSGGPSPAVAAPSRRVPQNAPVAGQVRAYGGYQAGGYQGEGYQVEGYQAGGYYVVQPSPCHVRGLFGGFCNCGCLN
jgi:hypothetical protein